MHIDIISDTVCPWCYVGKRRFERALDSVHPADLTIDWRTFMLNPEMPPEGVERSGYMVRKFGTEGRVREIYERLGEAGAGEGIGFAFERIARMPRSLDSHRLIRWAAPNEHQTELVQEIFAAFFERGDDIGDVEVLAAAASGAGLDAEKARSFLLSDKGVEAILDEDREVKALGIHSVPCFVIDGHYVISGAQPAEAFLPVFELAEQEAPVAP